jgi:hypothetical protein
MSEVKRLKLYHSKHEDMTYPVEAENGSFVLYSDYAALLARHNALVEAVAWERECCQDIRPLVAWADLYVRHGEDYVDSVADDLRAIQDAARAEVDRILMEPTP